MKGKKFAQLSLIFLIIAIVIRIISVMFITIFILSSFLIPFITIVGYVFLAIIILSLIFGIIAFKKRLNSKYKIIAWICVILDIIFLIIFLISLFTEVI